MAVFFFCLKLTEQSPGNVSLFDASSQFIKKIMYVSLGILAGLLLMGTLWEMLMRKKRRINQSTALGEDKHFIVTLKRGIIINWKQGKDPQKRRLIRSR